MIYRSKANCQFCVHYQGEQRCLAFPSGIPADLWSGENLHHESYPGDGGYRHQNIELSDPRKRIAPAKAA